MISTGPCVSPFIRHSTDVFGLPNISGTGANVFVRGAGVYARRWHGLGRLDVEAVDVWQDVFRPTVGDAVEVPCVRYQDGRLTPELHRYYEVPQGLEWEIIWPDRRSVPRCGYVDFSLRTSPGATWYYQPQLTNRERETCERPENVVGSWACYAPHSGRYLRTDGSEIVNFETGKLCHLYRSFLRTARGETCWCCQLIAGEKLRVRLPLKFVLSLGPRDYPLTFGPTFGYTSVGGSSGTVGSGNIYAAGSYTPTGDGTLVSCTGRHRYQTSTAAATLGVYNHSSGPSSLVTACTEFSVPSSTAAWYTGAVNVAASISSGSSYWLAVMRNANAIYIYYDSVANSMKYKAGLTYVSSSLPDPYPASPDSIDWKMSIYATYTAAATGFPFPLLYQRVHGSPFCRR